MNDNEAIDQAIALLEKLRPQKKPRERWGVMDRDSDVRLATYTTRAEAEEHVALVNKDGCYGPYSLVHIVEVIE